MARPVLFFGLAAFGGLVLAERARRRTAPIPPAGAVLPGGPPAVVTPAVPSSPANVTPAPAIPKPPEPKPPAAQQPEAPAAPGMAVSVTLPLGWRRMDPSEWTPTLHDTVNQVMAAGFPVGSFAPFDLDSTHYAVLVEQDETGLQNVSIAIDEGVKEPT